jgi:hypothetical protein
VLLPIVAVAAVGGFVSLIVFAMLAVDSARSLQRAVAGARAQLMPAVEELAATAQQIAERAQNLRPHR